MRFHYPDAVVIGSGANGGIVAKILAEGGMKVLLLEKGDNHFVGLDRPEGITKNRFSNDDLKFIHRDFIDQDPRIEPRTFRRSEGEKVSVVGKVNSLATTVGKMNGFNSAVFAIAFFFALVVMYDAAGVRKTVGTHSGILNRILDELFKDHPEFELRFREFIGHTRLEIAFGAILGILLALWWT